MALSDDERKAKRREWQRKYRAIKGKEKYETKYKEENKLRMKKYNVKPKVIEKRKEYNKSPERRVKMKERWAKPETKMTIQKYRASPQGKTKMKEYYTSDKVKIKKNDDYSKFSKEAKIIVARGNLSCACCGNKNFKWLQIDHIVPQRRSKNNETISSLARHIVQGNRSNSEFQLLCANCNFAKRDHKACPIDHSLD